MVAGVAQAQPQQVAELELAVVHGLGRDQDPVRASGERGKHLAGVTGGEVRVGDRGGAADPGGVDPVEILQVVADIGVPVLHRLGGGHAGQCAYPLLDAGRQPPFGRGGRRRW